jgi:arylsulfatase A-like enzyme
LRSGKGSLYEGGTRDPFVIRCPGKIKPGTVCDVPMIHVDLYPTLLEIAGVPAPENYILDGESMLPVLGGRGEKMKRDAIYQHFPGYLGAGEGTWRTTPVGVIQMGDWKLMEFFEDSRLELYNLKDDIGETHNLAQEQPDRVKAMHEKMLAWRASVKAPMPTANTAETSATGQGKGKGKKKKNAAAEEQDDDGEGNFK